MMSVVSTKIASNSAAPRSFDLGSVSDGWASDGFRSIGSLSRGSGELQFAKRSQSPMEIAPRRARRFVRYRLAARRLERKRWVGLRDGGERRTTRPAGSDLTPRQHRRLPPADVAPESSGDGVIAVEDRG